MGFDIFSSQPNSMDDFREMSVSSLNCNKNAVQRATRLNSFGSLHLHGYHRDASHINMPNIGTNTNIPIKIAIIDADFPFKYAFFLMLVNESTPNIITINDNINANNLENPTESKLTMASTRLIIAVFEKFFFSSESICFCS